MPENLSNAAAEQQPELTLAQNLALLEEQTSRLEAELPDLAGKKQYPDWWINEGIDIRVPGAQLRQPNADPAFVSSYFQLSGRQRAIRAKITGFDLGGIDPVWKLCDDLGAEIAGKGFAVEAVDGPIHKTLLDHLTIAATESVIIKSDLDLLKYAYDKKTVTDLLGIQGDAYSNALRPLLRSDTSIRAMRAADAGTVDVDEPWESIRAKAQKWMSHALSAATGMAETEASEYTFSASQRGANKSIITLLDRFDTFGVQRLRDLAGFTGLYDFENYSISQLLLMEELLHNPQETAERLSAHDVTVLMTNRSGDTNGVMDDAAEIFEDGKGRTLIFGIRRMSDIYKHMLQLQERGIKPSTLVLASHSASGEFTVSDKRDAALKRYDVATIAGRTLVQAENASNVSNGRMDIFYSMHGMKGMARLVDDLMTPSRGLDDNPESIGRKRIIFQACYAAHEVASKDIGKDGATFSMGMDSVTGRLAKNLALHGNGTKVDIYGADVALQMHKTEEGVRYSRSPRPGERGRQRHPAVRIRVENGVLDKQEVEEIRL